MTEEWFDFKYQPITNEDDDWQVDVNADLSNIDINKIWTVLDVDGVLYLSPGKHFVNRMYYVICEIARTEDWEDDVEVYLEDLYNVSEIIEKVKGLLINEFDVEDCDEVDDLLQDYF